MKRVLVIDDDPDLLDNVLELLEAEGFDGVGAADGKAGVAAALARVPDLIVCDIGMPVMDGHTVLRHIRDYPETSMVPFIFLTARAERADIREGMNLGADDYLTKPFARTELLAAIRSRLERYDRLARPRKPGAKVDDEAGPIVRSAALAEVFEAGRRAARSDLPVLLLGETGVGKDVLAHAIHKASPRAAGPFMPLNCPALAGSILESELFGHEQGAFTGAARRRIGLFEAAEGGTVFLDEVGDLSLATQAALLRVLEDRRVLRVGGRSFVDVDVRFVCATNKHLDEEVEAGRFRQDLYYRVGVVVLTIPPLRDRHADIAPLARRFARGMSHRMGWAEPVALTDETIAALEAWSWPGNVRELRNAVERAVALSNGEVVGPELLPRVVREGDEDPQAVAAGDLPEELRRQQRELERKRIVAALEEHGGNQTRAADALGISRRTLVNRLDEFDLPRPRK